MLGQENGPIKKILQKKGPLREILSQQLGTPVVGTLAASFGKLSQIRGAINDIDREIRFGNLDAAETVTNTTVFLLNQLRTIIVTEKSRQ